MAHVIDPAGHTVLQPKLHAAMPRSGASLAVRYALFAGIATGINVAVQALVSALYHGPFQFWIVLLCGTAAGIGPKYLLDKRWIFADSSAGMIRHARKFTLYQLTAVATTLLFWLIEFGFDRVGGDEYWRYVGAVIGLAAGYWTKYHLDRRYVFGAVR
jgi:putative flippase GtrA